MPKKLKIDIRWFDRYSSTMENDKHGRWARIAHAGKFDKIIVRGKPCNYEIAWINKIPNSTKFQIIPQFPCNIKTVHDDLKSAKKEVERSFKWFIKNCINL